MAGPVELFVPASLAAGVGTLYLINHLRQYRDKPGATLFLASLTGQATWCFAYSAALLVSVPPLRWVLELVVWIAMAVTGLTFLGFGLAYTGRAGIVRSLWYRLMLATGGTIVAFVLTNHVHHLVWSGYRIDPLGPLHTATYTFEPVGYVTIGGGVLAVLTGSLLLFDTVLSYGRLYRSEALAVSISTLPPVAGLVTWLFGAGPVPELHLTTAFFLPHVALDLYAFVGSDMFEFHPATRRAGERAAIEDLGSPVIIVDEEARVITLNGAASRAFGSDKREAQTLPLAAVLGVDTIDPEAGEQEVTLPGPEGRREYSVTPAALRDEADTHVGHTLVFQDITAERRRKQRLEVLNRILRHNLRNDLNVVGLYVGQAADETEGEVATWLDRARAKTADLAALGEKARRIEAALEAGSEQDSTVSLLDLVDDIIEDQLADYPDADLTADVPADLDIETSPALLGAVLSSLVENGILHDEASAGRVRISATLEQASNPIESGAEGTPVEDTRTGMNRSDEVRIEVTDSGPGIPQHELSVIEEGSETDLEHGSGLGLWLVHWGVRTLGGTVSFESSSEGTTASVRLPHRGSWD